MQRDSAYLRDIQESVRRAVSYLEGGSLESFIGDTKLLDVVIRRIEIIGEAARRVSEETHAEHPSYMDA